MNTPTIEDANQAKSWPFQEARALIKRLGKHDPSKPVLFETGYGPSGLPHIGTFGEVVRTTMVRQAFQQLTGNSIASKIITFSDDMDGLRKVPDNVPNQELLQKYLQKPLTVVPDPFGCCESFAHHNNNKLREFLDQFGFEYEFMSSTDCYKSGKFDGMLMRVLERYDDVLNVMLPTLGAERRATYSPFLPISPTTGRVLYVPVLERNVEAGTIVIEDEDGSKVEMPVTGGNVKLQWKADWAGRWYALGIDYEMAGEDLTESIKISSRITKALGGNPPSGFNYQLFLDENGEKISKSKGNGISIEQWLRYATPESLALYMFHQPKKSKKLYFDVIPKTVEDYFAHRERYPTLEGPKLLDSPAWHIHNGKPPERELPVSFSLLLNLVSAADADDKDKLWGFIRSYAPDTGPETHPEVDKLLEYALNYYEDFVKPSKVYRAPTDIERAAMEDLLTRLDEVDAGENDPKALQSLVFASGKTQPFEQLRDWFKGLYEVLLGQSQGPRFGSLIAIFGVAETKELIRQGLAGANLK